MEQPTALVILYALISILILCCILNILVFWPDIYLWFYLTMHNYKRRRRIAILEKKIAALEKPPRATFFSRVDGKYTTIEGPEEKQYLSQKKKRKCRRNKKSLPQVVDKKNDV